MLQDEMRDAYGRALLELGGVNADVYSVDADVSVSTRSIMFAEKYPERSFNVGISELHMAAMAAGLSTTGIIPFVNAFAVFISLRSADAVHNIIAHDNLNVKLVGSYCGFSCGQEGASHHSINDIAHLRSMPNMTVLSLCDNSQTKKAVFAAAAHNGPVYLRIAKTRLKAVYKNSCPFTIGKANLLRKGEDVTIFATGSMVYPALVAAEELGKHGISAMVVDVHTIKPLDNKLIIDCAQRTGAVVTAEEHSKIGGLGGAISECLSQYFPTHMRMVGVEDRFGESGSHSDLLNLYGLNASGIQAKVVEVLGVKESLKLAKV